MSEGIGELSLDDIEKIVAVALKQRVDAALVARDAEIAAQSARWKQLVADHLATIDRAESAEAEIAALRVALAATEQPLKHASQCLDGIVTQDEEDMTKDGGSATCQSVKKTIDRALKNVRATLGKEG